MRRAAFADPANPRYVADEAVRRKAIDQAVQIEQASRASETAGDEVAANQWERKI